MILDSNGRQLRMDSAWHGWHVLRGGGNWASIEGSDEEWTMVATTLRGGESITFKRLSCVRTESGWDFCSPRNAYGPNDVVHVPSAYGEALADEIARCLSEQPKEVE